MSVSQHLEPAERDPKKLRRTVWVLVLIMVVGGWLVMQAYNKWAVEKAADDRPAIIHRIMPNKLRVVRQDGQQADLADLRRKVFAIHVVHLDQPEDSARSLAVLKRLAHQYSAEQDFRVVTLILNPGPAETVVAKLDEVAKAMGVSMPQWWVAANSQEKLAKFIRQHLKPSVPPEEVDGRWEFDASVILIDRNGHLRRAVVPQKSGGQPYVAVFDFDQAAKWDADGVKTGTELNNEQELEKLLIKTIDQLLEEPYQD